MSERTGASGAAAEAFDPRDFRNALGTYPTGVTIVTTADDAGMPVGLTCNSFSSVSLSPPLVLWSLSLRSPSLSTFLQGAHFAVNILALDQAVLARRFSQSIPDKFSGVAFRRGIGGAPLLDGAVAHLQCRNETRYYSGDHVIFIGHVLHYEWRECAPLVYCLGDYTELTPDTAA